ncbi:MAG: hypothetical protein ACFB51_12840 [Anaerolineae bacterium]
MMHEIDLETFDWPQSIRGINGLEVPVKERLYLSLIPPSLVTHFDVDPADRERLRFICPHDTRSVEIVLYPTPGTPPPIDPIVYLHMADTLNNKIAVMLMQVNNPEAERFNTDVSQDGLPTRFGTLRRNIPEEVRAMQAGLSPGQVRKGLRISREAIPTFETFLGRTGNELVIIEPLTYTNAIVYESYGFAYYYGRQRMEWIDKVLRPGGDLIDRFDGSSPFRQPDAWRTVRGRAWAIYDGILGEPLGDLRMYKRIGHHAGVNTFPDAAW